jgi:hypothetical protein
VELMMKPIGKKILTGAIAAVCLIGGAGVLHNTSAHAATGTSVVQASNDAVDTPEAGDVTDVAETVDTPEAGDVTDVAGTVDTPEAGDVTDVAEAVDTPDAPSAQ